MFTTSTMSELTLVSSSGTKHRSLQHFVLQQFFCSFSFSILIFSNFSIFHDFLLSLSPLFPRTQHKKMQARAPPARYIFSMVEELTVKPWGPPRLSRFVEGLRPHSWDGLLPQRSMLAGRRGYFCWAGMN